MTAHVVYTGIDADAPATVSKCVIEDIVRRAIGFGGLLMTDDLSMKALTGTLAERATGALAAGCDLALHCNGNPEEMEAVSAVCPPLEGASLARYERALAVTAARPEPFDEARARAECEAVLAAAAAGDAPGDSPGDDPTA